MTEPEAMQKGLDLCIRAIGEEYYASHKEKAVVRYHYLMDCIRVFVGFRPNKKVKGNDKLYETDFRYYACARVWAGGRAELVKSSPPKA